MARRSTRRTRTLAAASVCGLAAVAVVVLAVALSQNVVYFRTVSEAVHDRAGSGRFRLAGQVVPGTIHPAAGGVRFALTDGKATVEVQHRGDPPELFKADAPVVCEGRWRAGPVRVFDSDRIMIKHGSEYRPPKVDTRRAPAPGASA